MATATTPQESYYAAAYEVAQGSVERARLVHRRRAGREHILSFNPEPLEEAATWIEAQRAFWTARLDVLERELSVPETKQRERSRR